MTSLHPVHPLLVPGADVPTGDRLLLLSPHFPPGQAAGARRWEKLARFAAERGFGLDVFTFSPQDLPSKDMSRLEALPEGTRVFGVPAAKHALSRGFDRIWSAVGPLLRRGLPVGAASTGGDDSASVTAWLRREEVLARGYTPAACVSSLRALLEIANENAWADAAAEAAQSIVDPRVHRAIISCGPPHLIHRAAHALSLRTGIPLVVDLRDPWSRSERLIWSIASPTWYSLAEHFERKAFAHASLIVMNTPAARQAMCKAYPDMAERILSVTNGFDDDELPEPRHGRTFVIAFAGSIYLDRSPRNLFRAVRTLSDDLGLDATDLRVELMGHFEPEVIRQMGAAEGVGERLVLHPPGNVRDVTALLARAAMLVNLPQDSNLAIPSKIFEYMVYPAWLLALAVGESATGQVLAGTGADVVDPDDVAGIVHAIRERYLAYREGQRPRSLAEDPRLGRAHQAGVLFDAIERFMIPSAPRVG